MSRHVSQVDDANANENDDDDDDDEDEDDDEDVEDEEEQTSNKRNAADAEARKAKKAKVEEAPEIERMVYCAGLPWKADRDSISTFFEGCGEIVNITQPLNPQGRSSGTAFVTFRTLEATAMALEKNREIFPGTERWVKVIRGSHGKEQNDGAPRENTVGTPSIFVGNLAWEVDEDSLREAFANCGEILSIRFATDRETGEFKGFGHIDFDSPEAATKAVNLSGTEVCGRAMRCDFASSKRTSDGGGRGRGRGRGGGRGGGFGRGGRTGGGGSPTLKKASGSIPRGAASNKKITF